MDPRTSKLVVGSIIFVVILFIVMRWYRLRTKSAYTYADIQTGLSPPETTTYSNIISCQSTYNTANATATTDATRTTIMTTFTDCVRSNVGIYVDTKCKWITLDPSAATNASAGEITAYGTYVTDSNNIQAAYADLVTKASVNSADAPTTEIVNAALKADITGATRKYLATVCPNYFKTSSGDPTSTYSSWSVVTGATAPAAGLYGFYASGGKITKAAVDAWAAKAARYTTSDATNEFTVGTPYLASGSTYMTNTTFTNSDGSFVKNWELMRDNGPGTNNPQV